MTRKQELQNLINEKYRELASVNWSEYTRQTADWRMELSTIQREEARVAEEKRVADKAARLASEGKTRETSETRLAEIQEQVKALLIEAEQHCLDYGLTFEVGTNEMEEAIRITSYRDSISYEGLHYNWDSSNC
jgi:DNA repair exonuclease SbcCD ATPase subunit